MLWIIYLYLSIRKSYIINLYYIHHYGSKAKQQEKKEEQTLQWGDTCENTTGY